MMIVPINGEKKKTGSSAIVLAMKYADTPYILFACSLKKTGLSCEKVLIVPNILPINWFTDKKNKAPKICIDWPNNLKARYCGGKLGSTT